METLDAFLRESASWHAETCRATRGEPDQRTFILDGLHRRALRTLGEVISLLENGWVDGAHARCRTLYELSVVSNVLLHATDDTLQRYLDYRVVTDFSLAEARAKHAGVLIEPPPPEEELSRLRRERDDAVKKYGKPFKRGFGWAAHLVPGSFRGLTSLEEIADLEHNRPYYELACINVHPDPRGLFWSMGLPNDISGVLAGATDAGLALPGQSACISAHQCTLWRLLLPALHGEAEYAEALLRARLSKKLVDLCCAAFARATEAFEQGRQEMLAQTDDG
jgi:hypothetical protein